MFDDFTNRIPMFWKVILGGLPIFCIIFRFAYLNISGRMDRQRFYESSINSLVIQAKVFEGRTKEFKLENGMALFYFINSDNLRIGDSISKKINTFEFDVYRKTDSFNFIYFGTFDSKKIN
jgi:hypothetical protein